MKKIFIAILVSLFLTSPVFAETLSTSVVGNGTISGGGTYNNGDTATVTATPGNGSYFSNWSGDLSGSSNPTSLTMDSDKNVVGIFVNGNGGPYWMLAQGLSSDISVNGHSVSYMTRQFGEGVLLISKNPTGLISDVIGKTMAGKASYDYLIMSNNATYHTIDIPDNLKGTYYVIPAVKDIAGNIICGTEFQVNL